MKRKRYFYYKDGQGAEHKLKNVYNLGGGVFIGTLTDGKEPESIKIFRGESLLCKHTVKKQSSQDVKEKSLN